MSVRNSLLAILTVGPAYGFQLHGELQARTAGRRTVNVGQIYGTLERLVRQGAVESAGLTDDGLPLYRLTASGRAEALHWLHATQSAPGEEWNDLVSRVLIASSLPDIDVFEVVERYRAAWETGGAADQGGDAAASCVGPQRLAATAENSLSEAALRWLDDVEHEIRRQGAAAFHREFSHHRPRRGRRPAAGYVASA